MTVIFLIIKIATFLVLCVFIIKGLKKFNVQPRTVITFLGLIIVPFVILIFQFTPYLSVATVSGGFSGTGKIYFYVENHGGLPAEYIKGRFIITSHKENDTNPQETEREFVLASGEIDTKSSVIFYPSGKSGRTIPVVCAVDKHIEKKLGNLNLCREHTYVSIYFKYPRFWKFPFWQKRYEGVFNYSPVKKQEYKVNAKGQIEDVLILTDYQWKSSSQTIYPFFFSKIFKAFREGRFPSLPNFLEAKVKLINKGIIKQEFPTSFGTLKRGMTQVEVKKILGEPHHFPRPYNRSQIWWYQFTEDRRVVVYFIDGKVTEVVEKEGVTSGEI